MVCLGNISVDTLHKGDTEDNLIYKDECLFVCLFICLFVCMDLIQIHISEPIWTKLCTPLPLGLEETAWYVWARNSWPLRPFGPFFFRVHCRIMGTRWLPARPSSAIPLYPWFQLFAWRHRHDVVADGGVIRGSLISVIIAGVPLTSRKLRRSRRVIRHSVVSLTPADVRVTSRILRSTGRQGHPPQRYIPHSSSCFCDPQEITSLQTTVARFYSKCVALSVMRTIRRDVNGICVSTIRNIIRREGSD
jgi:hypothetical protein